MRTHTKEGTRTRARARTHAIAHTNARAQVHPIWRSHIWARFQQERCRSFGAWQNVCSLWAMLLVPWWYTNGAWHKCYLKTSSPFCILSSLEIKLYSSHFCSILHSSRRFWQKCIHRDARSVGRKPSFWTSPGRLYFRQKRQKQTKMINNCYCKAISLEKKVCKRERKFTCVEHHWTIDITRVRAALWINYIIHLAKTL